MSLSYNDAFVGRKKELSKLNLLLQKRSSSLVVVKGRRRIGKSRLIQEFAKSHRIISIAGLAPVEGVTTLQDQLKEFGWQLGRELGQPAFKDDDWNDLFLRLANHTREGRVIILLDEISWMGSEDPFFLSKLKNAWDLEYKKNPELILVLCGSVTAWIEKNILNSSGFLGRVSLSLTLEELSLKECNQFWQGNKNISTYEKLKILSVTGGVPKYLEEIQLSLPAEENIKNLCFDASGLLFNEFERIFTDIFSKRSEMYRRIVQCIVDGHYEFEEICKKMAVEKSGVISEYFEELVLSGFIRRDYTWHVKDGKAAKLSHFRLSDNYLRFYLKYIAPNKEKIQRNGFELTSLASMPGWSSLMGLQFENLVLNNRKKIMAILNINPNEVIYDNPFFQNKTTRQQGCQIDYMIQTRYDSLYVCEIKFSKYPIKPTIIAEVEEKIKRLKVPRYISRRPILIHVNGVKEEVIDSQCFSNIIDFGELL